MGSTDVHNRVWLSFGEKKLHLIPNKNFIPKNEIEGHGITEFV